MNQGETEVAAKRNKLEAVSNGDAVSVTASSRYVSNKENVVVIDLETASDGEALSNVSVQPGCADTLIFKLCRYMPRDRV